MAGSSTNNTDRHDILLNVALYIKERKAINAYTVCEPLVCTTVYDLQPGQLCMLTLYVSLLGDKHWLHR
jgi:hypothetical protein